MYTNEWGNKFERIEELKIPFVLFRLEVYMRPGILNNISVASPTLTEFIIVQSTDADRRTTLASVVNQNTHFSVDTHGVLLRVLLLHGAAQQVAPPPFPFLFSAFTLCPPGQLPWRSSPVRHSEKDVVLALYVHPRLHHST